MEHAYFSLWNIYNLPIPHHANPTIKYQCIRIATTRHSGMSNISLCNCVCVLYVYVTDDAKPTRK